jgi:hypothetical protein
MPVRTGPRELEGGAGDGCTLPLSSLPEDEQLCVSLVVLAKADDVTIEGDPASYTDRGDSGEEVMRLFCGKCGSPIETATAGTRAGGMRILKAGVFAEQAPFTPALEIYCFRRQDWLPQLSNSATFERMPPPST